MDLQNETKKKLSQKIHHLTRHKIVKQIYRGKFGESTISLKAQCLHKKGV